MKKLSPVLFFILIISLNLISTYSYAQDFDPGFPLEGDPGAPAPIDDYLIPLLLTGVIGGYYFLRKKKSLN